jgi:DNA polymerase I-like protein with 3'-5' exonuclease and polymerase domains
MQEYTQPLKSTSLTDKQRKHIDELTLALSETGIEVRINDPLPETQDGLVALDVEHDESGGFVGCGFYCGTRVAYYYSSLFHLLRVPIHAFRIVAHNGVSDIECLQIWGIDVRYSQLFWDTMLLSHIIDSSLKDYSLKGMAKRELLISYPSYDDIVGKRGLKAERFTLDKQPLELVALYNSMDVYTTWELYKKQERILKAA